MITNQTKDNDVPKVGVVIPSYNSRSDLESCLGSLKFSTYSNLSMIVVDNASGDGAAGYVRSHWPNILLIEQSTNTGFARACNRGVSELRKMKVKYVMLLNQDTTVHPRWAEPLVEYLENHAEVAAVQSLLLRADGRKINSAGNRIHFLGFGYTEGDGRSLGDSRVQKFLRGPVEITYASGAAAMIRMAAIEELSLFQDDFFMYHEDLDFGWRVRLAGYKSVLVPESRVYHRYEFHRSSKIKYEYGERNRLIVLLENYHILTLFMILPAWLLMEIGVVTMSLLKGWWAEKISGYLYVIKNLSAILKTRKLHQAMRTVKERAVVAGFSGVIAYQEEPSLLLRAVNPIFNLYWRIVRLFIVW
ncbi:hypothetical protein A3H10_03375 [Candidatus Uhrbacteria bacterium RIFCSPLOWO2_12_FULL_46_10]|uniref:Glycosyltransferase 2-like domain-containing protein n=1 Tax=Candidatus Uhrbacteria bacterium RIFCSPLOWO2_01_FULL_47_25 TaxID=1802402 RepID=A0A1F7URE0_9BACT|nr:MAG: hypothetical protein A2752_00675 [Candidatus Uhrbacteria bacterium RIFCSPHIGHO2_01_FULL_46_23]OGL69205.1 MAG: hypothetical protein A3D60_04880 [Candidatus Uhrbacteria bacterium RIFCSPHIGHO2_02_FULL_47_29]OGL80268.1 MAG: hypothetical protein A2936_02785 [Candidatus Uhrbacteria bacterium RIFCSPLOWO2_01_FULL_47_25]OGL85343.1 MAG: hypothetical protein A3I37_00690 [Candidatus Uhrbacteria bacterium RIFCSPLOWO2_02_FULL_46_19]OGL91289.1 MAG: hypothetical protein A3H10_03375 [Candidatus Uhrbacte